MTPILNAVVVTKNCLSKVGNAGVTNAGTNVNNTVGLVKFSKDSMTRSKTSKKKMLNLQGTLRKCKNNLRSN